MVVSRGAVVQKSVTSLNLERGRKLRKVINFIGTVVLSIGMVMAAAGIASLLVLSTAVFAALAGIPRGPLISGCVVLGVIIAIWEEKKNGRTKRQWI